MKIAISLWGKCITQTDQLDWLPIRILRASGHTISHLESRDIDAYIAFEHYPEPTRIAALTVPLAKRILVTFEPRAVNPLMYNHEERSKYGHVLVPSERHMQNRNERVYKGGGLSSKEEVDYNLNTHAKKVRPPRTLGLINENKFSLVPGSLYSLRSRTLDSFSRKGIKISVAGANWEKPASWWFTSQAYALLQCIGAKQKVDLSLIRWPSGGKRKNIEFVGKVASSVEFQSRFAYSIVIENEASYVTEKLFNAIQAGCVPIYCGPPLADFGIPQNVAIEAKANTRALVEAFLSSDERSSREIIENGRAWIQDSATQLEFGHLASFERIGTLLKHTIEKF